MAGEANGISVEHLQVELAGLMERERNAYETLQQVIGARKYCEALLKSAKAPATEANGSDLRLAEGAG